MTAAVATPDPSSPRQELVYLEPPDRRTLDAERAELLQQIEEQLPAEICSPVEYKAIADMEARLGLFITRVEPLFDEHCDAAHKVWKSACKIRGMFIDAPKALKAKLRTLLGNYTLREERERREAERKLAEEERQREQERVKREAKLLDKQGQKDMAQALRETPVVAPAVSLPSAVPVVDNVSYRDDWSWEPIGGDTPENRARALAMIVPKQYLPFVKWNDAGLTAHARNTKGTVKVPGILFRCKKIMVRR